MANLSRVRSLNRRRHCSRSLVHSCPLAAGVAHMQRLRVYTRGPEETRAEAGGRGNLRALLCVEKKGNGFGSVCSLFVVAVRLSAPSSVEGEDRPPSFFFPRILLRAHSFAAGDVCALFLFSLSALGISLPCFCLCFLWPRVVLRDSRGSQVLAVGVVRINSTRDTPEAYKYRRTPSPNPPRSMLFLCSWRICAALFLCVLS